MVYTIGRNALAKQNDARLMTDDPEFKSVEHEVAIHWLPARRS